MLDAAIPGLVADYGNIWISPIGPPAAFRMLNIRESRNLRSLHAHDEHLVANEIIRRTLVYPSYEQYASSTLSGEFQQVAITLLEQSDVSDISTLSDHVEMARHELTQYMSAVVHRVSLELGTPVHELEELDQFSFLKLVVLTEMKIGMPLDPRSLEQSALKDEKKQQRRQKHMDKPGSTDLSGTKHTKDGIQASIAPDDVNELVHARKQAWEQISKDEVELKAIGKERQLNRGSIYSATSVDAQKMVAKNDPAISRLPFDVMAAVKHLRKRSTNSGLDMNNYQYLDE